MKKACFSILLLLLILPVFSLAETLTASFYPVYLFASNLTVGIDDLHIHCLAAPGTGCLHDYQLSTTDMKELSKSDALLINGAGMESFLSFVLDSLPDLPVIDASAGIPLLADEDSHGGSNPHIWLSAENACAMVTNLAEELIDLYPAHSEAITANRDEYLARLHAVDEELKEKLAPIAGQEIVTFHEAFPYFAQAYGLRIGGTIIHEEDESLSAYQLTQLIRSIQQMDHPVLFVEPQYDDLVARTLSQETGAPICELDPCVTGGQGDALVLTAYEDVMRANLAVLLEAFSGR